MPNCAPSKSLTSWKKQHGHHTGETDAARMWALARFPVATTKLEDTVAAIISLRETVERISARTKNGTARES
jgi:hypothetical protein